MKCNCYIERSFCEQCHKVNDCAKAYLNHNINNDLAVVMGFIKRNEKNMPKEQVAMIYERLFHIAKVVKGLESE